MLFLFFHNIQWKERIIEEIFTVLNSTLSCLSMIIFQLMNVVLESTPLMTISIIVILIQILIVSKLMELMISGFSVTKATNNFSTGEHKLSCTSYISIILFFLIPLSYKNPKTITTDGLGLIKMAGKECVLLDSPNPLLNLMKKMLSIET